MNQAELKERTKRFTLRVVRLVSALAGNAVGQVIRYQLAKAGTSVGANYRAACRARSRPEFIARLGVVLEEADECCFWREILMDAGLMPRQRLAPLRAEAEELVAIIAKSVHTAKTGKVRPPAAQAEI